MTREEAESILVEAGRAADGAFPLLDAALACALHEDPTRDPQPTRDLLAQAVGRLRERLKLDRPEEALTETLAGDLRLTGDLISYDHPGNADLIAVGARRKGLPVALGVYYIAAARRCGMNVAGVDFPAHFLLRVERLPQMKSRTQRLLRDHAGTDHN